MRHCWLVAMCVASGGVACVGTAPVPAPQPKSGRTVARISASADANLSSGGNLNYGGRGLPPCVKAAHFDGTATLGEGELLVRLFHPSIGVERHNNKQFDLLTLNVRVAEGRHTLGYDSNLEYRLSPTVDSAGPQITTWQGGDTLRMLLPWPRGIAARWLLFTFMYQATTYDGVRSDCAAIIRSDTLRFVSGE